MISNGSPAVTIVGSPWVTALPFSLSVKSPGTALPPSSVVTSLISVIVPLFVLVKVHVTVSLSSTTNVAIQVPVSPELFAISLSTQSMVVRSHPGSASSVAEYVPGNTCFSIVLP